MSFQQWWHSEGPGPAAPPAPAAAPGPAAAPAPAAAPGPAAPAGGPPAGSVPPAEVSPPTAPTRTEAPDKAPTGGDIYGAYLKSQVDFQQARKTNLESKASSIITTSGTLVTLLFGLVAVVTGTSGFVLPGAAHGWLIAAVVCFVVAAVFGIFGSVIPVPYGTLTFLPDKLAAAWKHSATVASINVAKDQIEGNLRASRRNDLKAWFVVVGGAAELAALLMLAVAVVSVLAAATPKSPASGATTTTVPAVTSTSRGGG